MKILRRLDVKVCTSNVNCPAAFELGDGRVAVIGTDVTAVLDGLLPPDASRGPDERIVAIPREVLEQARAAVLD